MQPRGQGTLLSIQFYFIESVGVDKLYRYPIVIEKLTAQGIIDQQTGGDELPLLPLFL